MTINTDYTYNISAKAIQEENYNRELPATYNIRIIQNGIIAPFISEIPNLIGEVITPNGELLYDVNSLSTYEQLKKDVLLDEISYIQNQSKLIEQTPSIYLGTIPICWGHYFTDGFSKIWYFYKTQKEEWKNHKIYFTSPYYNTKETPAPLIKLLTAVTDDTSIANRITPIQQITQFNTLIIPDNSLLVDHQKCSRHYTPEWNNTINIIINNISKQNNNYKKHQKIYFSRTKLTKKVAEFGELSIERSFKKAGFYIVYPEQIPFSEQLFYLQNCNTFATTEGSLGHNAVFCNQGTEVILLRKAWMQYDYQFCINQMRHLHVIYIDIHLSVFVTDNPNLGPFFLYRTNELCRFFKERYNLTLTNNFSNKKFMQYTKLCLKKNDFYYRHDSPKEMYTYLQEELSNKESILRKKSRKFLGNFHNDSLKSFIKKIQFYFTR